MEVEVGDGFQSPTGWNQTVGSVMKDPTYEAGSGGSSVDSPIWALAPHTMIALPTRTVFDMDLEIMSRRGYTYVARQHTPNSSRHTQLDSETHLLGPREES